MSEALIKKVAECYEVGLSPILNALPDRFYEVELNGQCDRWTEIGAIAYLSGEIARKLHPPSKTIRYLEQITEKEWESWLTQWLQPTEPLIDQQERQPIMQSPNTI